MVSIDKIM